MRPSAGVTPKVSYSRGSGNLPPTASGGPNQNVAAGTLVQLSGTGSLDPEGGPLTYQWTQSAGPMVVLANPAGATTCFTAPSVAATTVLTSQLVVSDGVFASLTNVVNITVRFGEPSVASNACLSTPVGVSAIGALTATDPGGQPLTTTPRIARHSAAPTSSASV